MTITTVIILNWNKADDTLCCLESLQPAASEQVQIIVVDNGSDDDSVERIRAVYPDLTIIETGTNLGYAEGNNVGIRRALSSGAEYVFVINNDAHAAPDTLDHLLAAAAAHPEAAFFGPKILQREAPDRIQSAGIEMDFLWRSRQRQEPADTAPQPVAFISGAALLMRSSALNKIGLLDPDFYLYREDIDWCLRARRAGYAIYYVPAAQVWHRNHVIQETDLPRITYYMTRNSLLLVRKHHGGLLRSGLITLRFLLTAASWTVRPRWRHKRRERNALLRGLVDYFSGNFGQGYT